MNSFMPHKFLTAIVIFIVLFGQKMFAQNTTEIKGKIYDIITQTPLSNVNVQLNKVDNNKLLQTVETNNNGEFIIKVDLNSKYELIFSLGSYNDYTITIDAAVKQPLTVYLEPKTVNLESVTIKDKIDDKAFFIMKNVIKNKSLNYKISAKQYNYLVYNKVEAFVTDIDSIKIQNSKLVRDINQIVEKNPNLKYKNSYLVPILLSETINKKYIDTDNQLSRSDLVSYNMSGIGIKDEETIAQFMNSDNLVNVNLSENNIQLRTKYFVSPLNDTWQLIYNVSINKDSIDVDGQKCVELYVYPKNKQVAAFHGTIVIRYKDYALISANLTMPNETVINFVKGFSIYQDFKDTGYGLMPQKTIIQLEMESELTNAILGGGKLIVKNTSINQDYKLQDQFLSNNFYSKVESNKASKMTDRNYWHQYNLTSKDSIDDNYAVIDKIRNIGFVKLVETLRDIISLGYVRGKPLVFYDILTFIAYNNIEGFRPQLGLRTTNLFNNSLILSGSLAYGFNDKKVKWSGESKLVLQKEPYTTLTVSAIQDVVSTALIGDNLYSLNTSAPLVSRMYKIKSKFGDLYNKKPMQLTSLDLNIEKQINNNFSGEFGIKQAHMLYVDRFNDIIYAKDPFNTSELILQVKYNPAKHIRNNEDQEISFQRFSNPQMRFWMILGSQNIFTESANYQKINFNVFQRNIKIWFLGTAEYDFNIGYINGVVPYPLLRTHIGNRSIFLFKRALSTVNEVQLVSDKYVSLNYHHTFNAPVFDYVPIVAQIRKYLSIDFVGSASIVLGSMSQANKDLLNDMANRPPHYFGNGIYPLNINKPFVEVGFGLTNIFNVFRIDIINKLTYRDIPGGLWNVVLSAELNF
ncbi:MAG: DUF5686 family protein [Solitalea-like symbiont of Tyrophagus putrescentiae]